MYTHIDIYKYTYIYIYIYVYTHMSAPRSAPGAAPAGRRPKTSLVNICYSTICSTFKH